MSGTPSGAALDFQRVYDEFHVRIRRYLVRLGGPGDADDLTQETFARVSQALAGFRGEAALSTWIYRIATNVALDRARSPRFQLQAHTAEPEALAALGTMPVIEQDIASREMSAGARDYVDQLPAGRAGGGGGAAGGETRRAPRGPPPGGRSPPRRPPSKGERGATAMTFDA